MSKYHFCMDCLGKTGPGSPCFDEPEERPEPTPQLCECERAATQSELRSGLCDVCENEIGVVPHRS